MSNLSLNKWEFPYDWVKTKLNEIDHVFEILEKYEKDKKSQSQKDIIKFNYLNHKYFYGNYVASAFSQNYQMIQQAKNQYQQQKVKSPKKNQFHMRDVSHLQEEIRLKKSNKVSQKENEMFKSMSQTHLTISSFKQGIQQKRKIKHDNTLNMDNMMNQYQQTGQFNYSTIRKQQGVKRMNIVDNQLTSLRKKTQLNRLLQDKFENNLNVMKCQTQNSMKVQELYQEVQSSKEDFQGGLDSERSIIQQVIRNKSSNKQMQRQNMKVIDKQDRSLVTYQKHKQYNDRLLTSIPKVIKPQFSQQFKDMLYNDGEGQRTLKIANQSQRDFFQSHSQNKYCENNKILQKQIKHFKQQNQIQRVIGRVDQKTNQKNSLNQQIIASKAFIKNPNQNKHKVLKAKNKFFVFEYRD